jgi:kinesin family protein 6/9
VCHFDVPRDDAAGYVNNQREKYAFRFDGVLGPDAKQDEVFERCAARPVLGALDGLNGTVFAYGQTGSGKTFTVTGGAERYVDRGIIPRAVQRLYAEIAKRNDAQYSVHVSYVEVYMDHCYDLLGDASKTAADGHGTSSRVPFSGSSSSLTLEDLPRVTLQEDDDGQIRVKNCSSHRAESEEDALNLLFIGDTNRAVTETPMNLASTRSHCVFTIAVERREPGSDAVRRAKVSLVDLAGSERVGKTGAHGQTLAEAKYINLSLHALEKVVIALQEKRAHVPYRDSTMTMLLKDALGGNCKTVMVATASPESEHLGEGISTCRFAQRIAMVANEVVVNEEVDPWSIVRRLRAENKDLRDELRLVKGENDDREALTASELERLARDVDAFVARGKARRAEEKRRRKEEEKSDQAKPEGGGGGENGEGEGEARDAGGEGDAPVEERLENRRFEASDADPDLDLGASMLKVRAATRIFRDLCVDAADSASAAATSAEALARAAELAATVRRREDEIAVLVATLRDRGVVPPTFDRPSNERQRPGATRPGTSASSASSGGGVRAPGTPPESVAGFPPGGGLSSRPASSGLSSRPASRFSSDSRSGDVGNDRGDDRNHSPSVGSGETSSFIGGGASISDRSASDSRFDAFRRAHPEARAVEDAKATLRRLYERAKALGEAVNASRERIVAGKAAIERRRVARMMTTETTTTGAAPVDDGDDAEEAALRRATDAEKAAYRARFEDLRAAKREIDHLQARLERSKARLRADFERAEGMNNAVEGLGSKAVHSSAPADHPFITRRAAAAAAAASSPPPPPPPPAAFARSDAARSPDENAAPREALLFEKKTPIGARVGVFEPTSGGSGGSAVEDPRGGGSSDVYSSAAAAAGFDDRARATPPTTGNAQADADIAAFYAARETLLRSREKMARTAMR